MSFRICNKLNDPKIRNKDMRFVDSISCRDSVMYIIKEVEKKETLSRNQVTMWEIDFTRYIGAQNYLWAMIIANRIFDMSKKIKVDDECVSWETNDGKTSLQILNWLYAFLGIVKYSSVVRKKQIDEYDILASIDNESFLSGLRFALIFPNKLTTLGLNESLWRESQCQK